MKRRRFVETASLVAGASLIGACSITASGGDPNAIRGSGRVISESRPVSGIRAIEVGGSARLEVVLDGPESLTVEAEDNIMPLVTSDLRNGTLVLGLKPNTSIATSKGITFKVTTAGGLESLKLTGSTSARVAEIKGPTKVGFVLKGSSKANVAYLYAESIEADLRGSSELTISGEAKDQRVTVFDSSSYVAEKLQTSTGSVTAANSGKAVVSVSQSLSATAQDSGSVRYVGSPSVSRQVSNSGKVEPR